MQQTNGKKKICLVTLSLGRGGAERSVGMLSEMLVERGYDLHTVSLNDEIYQPYKGKLFNLGKFKSGTDNLIKRFARFKKLRQFLLKEHFDLIIDNRNKNNYWREVFYSEYIYRGLKKIYVVRSYSLDNYMGRDLKLKNIYAKNIMNVSVSVEIQKQIEAKSGLDNFRTIHNAFDPEKLNEMGKLLLPSLPERYILSLGRIEDDIKNFSFLIKAYHQSVLPSKYIKLLILGNGKDLQKLKNLVFNLKLEDKVEFIPHTDFPYHYMHHAIFVCLTSRFEGFPRVLIESLGMGTPVVSVDCKSGPSEMVIDEENGLLVPEGDEKLFVEAINRMVEDEQLYNHCKANATKSVEHFSKSEIAEKWDQLIQEVLK